jgi:hypothetical protein
MRIQDIVRAPKTDVSCKEWQAGAMPKSLFPLGKSGKHYLNFRGGYEWCSVDFSCQSFSYRLLIAVDLAKESFYAHLGMLFEKDTRMLASYEYHATHRGWHVHAGCGSVEAIPVGRYMGSWKRRLKSRRVEWNVTKANALEVACKAFGIIPPPMPQQGSSGQMPLL